LSAEKKSAATILAPVAAARSIRSAAEHREAAVRCSLFENQDPEGAPLKPVLLGRGFSLSTGKGKTFWEKLARQESVGDGGRHSFARFR
jgi:hypothetical protein